MDSYLATIVLLLTATVVGTTHAFTIISPQLLSHHRPATALFGGKRRGRLTNNVSLDEDGNVARIMTKREKQKLGSSKMKKNNASSSATISPLLAEWAKDDDNSSSASSKESAPSTTTSTATTFIPFNNEEPTHKKKRKANKRAQRAALTAAQTQQIDTLLEQINDMLQTTNLDRVELVSLIKSLVTIGSSSSSSNNDQVLLPTLKSIVSTRSTTAKKDDETKLLPSYRLAWVGSDDAICHIGTSLHKVPLARLQEVFLTLGYNRWELYEVIRIIGPFPNVRNTLKGDIKLRKLSSSSYENEREGVQMEISYMSMIDGTGKEILAGKEDNIKYVNLDVWFANEKVIVCTVPSEDNDNGDGDGGDVDPFTGDGSNVLFFVGEENLDEQLEKLRAA